MGKMTHIQGNRYWNRLGNTHYNVVNILTGCCTVEAATFHGKRSEMLYSKSATFVVNFYPIRDQEYIGQKSYRRKHMMLYWGIGLYRKVAFDDIENGVSDKEACTFQLSVNAQGNRNMETSAQYWETFCGKETFQETLVRTNVGPR